MKLLERITNHLVGLSHPTPPAHDRQGARAALASGEADTLTLREFEKRFKITETDHETKTQGYPKSIYYKPETPEEIEHNRRVTDAFLDQ